MPVNNRSLAWFIPLFFSAIFLASCGDAARRSEENAMRRSPSPHDQYAEQPAMADTAGFSDRKTFGADPGEEYGRIYENDFLSPAQNPLSTFSIDVDPASYSNVRRFIQDGHLPPADAVRIEELVNYFSYDYPQPAGEHPFSITTEIARCPWNPRNKLVQIGLQGKEIVMDHIPPSNLVFLIDVSGSMNQPDKLPLLQRGFKLMVERLRSEDRVAIVTYAGDAGLALRSTAGNRKDEILEAINELEPGGSTAGGEGIHLAYNIATENFIADGNNRVILATDGDFNVGVTSDEELVSLIEQKRETGVFLTVLGFGQGNLKDAKMEQIADKGNGQYAYIDGMDEARRIFVDGLSSTLFTIAKDVKIQVEFNPAHVKSYRLVGYENRMLAAKDFNDDVKDAGELGAGHSVTALYEIVPADAGPGKSGVDPLKYQSPEKHPELYTASVSGEIMNVKLRYKHPKQDESRLIVHPVQDRDVVIGQVSNNLRFAAAVAEWGMLLRNSKYKGESNFENVLAMARGARGEDLDGSRAEFINLVSSSYLFSGGHATR